jgi:hypothetical protein
MLLIIVRSFRIYIFNIFFVKINAPHLVIVKFYYLR